MNPERRAEYHRTIDMLRRCAERQASDDPLVGLEGVEMVALDDHPIDEPIIGLESRGESLHILTEHHVYVARYVGGRLETMLAGIRFIPAEFFGQSLIEMLSAEDVRLANKTLRH